MGDVIHSPIAKNANVISVGASSNIVRCNQMQRTSSHVTLRVDSLKDSRYLAKAVGGHESLTG